MGVGAVTVVVVVTTGGMMQVVCRRGAVVGVEGSVEDAIGVDDGEGDGVTARLAFDNGAVVVVAAAVVLDVEMGQKAGKVGVVGVGVGGGVTRVPFTIVRVIVVPAMPLGSVLGKGSVVKELDGATDDEDDDGLGPELAGVPDAGVVVGAFDHRL